MRPQLYADDVVALDAAVAEGTPLRRLVSHDEYPQWVVDETLDDGVILKTSSWAGARVYADADGVVTRYERIEGEAAVARFGARPTREPPPKTGPSLVEIMRARKRS